MVRGRVVLIAGVAVAALATSSCSAGTASPVAVPVAADPGDAALAAAYESAVAGSNAKVQEGRQLLSSGEIRSGCALLAEAAEQSTAALGAVTGWPDDVAAVLAQRADLSTQEAAQYRACAAAPSEAAAGPILDQAAAYANQRGQVSALIRQRLGLAAPPG